MQSAGVLEFLVFFSYNPYGSYNGNAVIIKRKDNGKIIACVENDVNRQLHDFIIQNEGKVHALYYIWKYGKNRIYGCAYIRNRDEHR